DALKKHEAAVWNAFVSGLCVKAISPAPKTAPVFVVQADIRAVCRALPGSTNRRQFARAFLVQSRTDDQYRKGCAAATIPREPMTLVGLRGDSALGNWASTALAANAEEVDDYYAMDLALASPKAVQGWVEYNAVAPFRPDPPAWSLKEWEESGIC